MGSMLSDIVVRADLLNFCFFVKALVELGVVEEKASVLCVPTLGTSA